MKPTIGRIVHYTLTEYDAIAINQRRGDAVAFGQLTRQAATAPLQAGEPGRTGHIEHYGNSAATGDVFPAMVVRDWNADAGTVNLQVHLDGNDTYWATSRTRADDEAGEHGKWHWPPRAEHQPGDRPAQF